ncbi:serine hydrolase domain-containing protein [Flaviaesturariibacter amylovorans]|uniref:Beta-lactamase-related domain-containing protein n=1 Tax=Flaviaesturariibacter amylovorans TaxID=1084520 RepID=A0ABP8H2H2_9BACT
MKQITCLLISLAFCHLSAGAQSYEAAGRKVDSLFSRYTRETPGAAVAIVKEGRVIFRKGYGMAHLDHDIPVTPRTVFNIASVSKQFTAFAVYLLESEGKLSFDDDVHRYISELPDYGTPIRIRHLLAHTGGLRDQAALLSLAGWSQDAVTTEQIMKLVTRQTGTNFPAGTRFNYSNTGYTLLAEVVQRVSGKKFADFTRERIFVPLGMTSTQFCDDHERIVRNKAESYERVGNAYHHKPLNVSNPGPSNLLTTVEDLARWVMNFEQPVVGTRALLDAFNAPSLLDDGSKVVLRVIGPDTIFHAKGQNVSNYKGTPMYSHGGHAAAFRTYMGRFPEHRFAIIALSNDEHNESLNARWQIADLYLPGLAKDNDAAPRPVTRAAAAPASYTSGPKAFEGTYYNEDLQTSYTLMLRNGQLLMTHPRVGDIVLQRTGEQQFSGSGPRTFAFELEFLHDRAGAVNAFSISNFGVKQMKFVRVK